MKESLSFCTNPLSIAATDRSVLFLKVYLYAALTLRCSWPQMPHKYILYTQTAAATLYC